MNLKKTMNLKKNIMSHGKTIMTAWILAVCLLTGCRQDRQPQDEIVTFQMSPSPKGVADFLRFLDEYDSGYESDRCFNVTPEEISERYHFSVFKFDQPCGCYLLYEDEIYPLGRGFGGYGVTSFAIADLNGDGAFEIYFTYSWGSGIPRSEVGYFDTASKETVLFDFSCWFAEAVLEAEEGQALCVYNADCHVKSFVDIEMTAEDKIASIRFESGKISIREEAEYVP